MAAYKCKTCLREFYCLFDKCNGCDGCVALDNYGICEDCNSSPKNVEDLNKIVRNMQATISHLNDRVIALEKEVTELKNP